VKPLTLSKHAPSTNSPHFPRHQNTLSRQAPYNPTKPPHPQPNHHHHKLSKTPHNNHHHHHHPTCHSSSKTWPKSPSTQAIQSHSSCDNPPTYSPAPISPNLHHPPHQPYPPSYTPPPTPPAPTPSFHSTTYSTYSKSLFFHFSQAIFNSDFVIFPRVIWYFHCKIS